jgi:acetyl-CoA/propionyl-CoA carboxylase, biotin carboxylase, biotin carboxyl carrier protein
MPLPGASPARTYLDMARVLRAAADSGADAIHPGYGFLADSAEFARAVLDAGLTWIGPSPAAIELLGDKLSARRVARRVGVPLLPGMTGSVRDAMQAVAFARKHGLPIVIKAASGGGGSGVAVVRSIEEIPGAYVKIGRARCLVERYLDHARHVETQCLADRYGAVVVVSTRDCSLQRRQQKIVEEAPAPFLDAEKKSVLRDVSVAILRAAAYDGAATCEFLLGPDGTLAFLEVSPRLSVAHPVSEEIAGLDLVRETIRIAAGEPLGYGDPAVRGHAVQFRIYAEDPGRGFSAPAAGLVRGWRPPAGPGVRLDAGVERGSLVVSEFGTLLAKLIVTGASRAEALARARRALREFEVDGVVTNLAFHRWVVDQADFAAAAVHTGYVGGAWSR